MAALGHLTRASASHMWLGDANTQMVWLQIIRLIAMKPEGVTAMLKPLVAEQRDNTHSSDEACALDLVLKTAESLRTSE